MNDKTLSVTPAGNADEASTSVRAFIIARIIEIAAQQKRRLAPLDDKLPLLQSGLDSLCIAILVAALDDHFDFDPFADDSIALPVTLGDFIALYQNASV